MFADSLTRLHDFEVRAGEKPYHNMSNSMFQQNQLCYGFYSVYEKIYILRNCDTPVEGRYLSVQIIKPCPEAKHPNCQPDDGKMNV